MKQKLTGKQKEWLVLLVAKAGWNTRDLVKVAGIGGFDQIQKLTTNELVELGISEKKAARTKILSKADWLEMKEKLSRVKARVIVRGDEGYPNKLGELMQPPEILFVRGRVEILDKTVSVVGTRKPSEYGRQMTRLIVAELVAQGITIISGLAYGVDGLAQESAVENGGTTIGVLGQGIDQVYPSKHLQLAHRILESGGGLVSEYPPGYPALRQNFAARNRIISGMSHGVIVVEGALKSGTMITAEFAQAQGRALMAVPGMANSVNSQTPNELIRKGAVLVRNGAEWSLNLRVLRN